MKSFVLLATLVTFIGFLNKIRFANGIQCYQCAHSPIPLQTENYIVTEACDIDREPNSTFLHECEDQSCLTASNYKHSDGIYGIFRTCIQLPREYEDKCGNYTKEIIQQLLPKDQWTNLIVGEIEVCSCKTEGCNWVKEAKSGPKPRTPIMATSETPESSQTTSRAQNINPNLILLLLIAIGYFLVGNF